MSLSAMITRRDSLERRVDKYGELICEGCGSFNQGGDLEACWSCRKGWCPECSEIVACPCGTTVCPECRIWGHHDHSLSGAVVGEQWFDKTQQ